MFCKGAKNRGSNGDVIDGEIDIKTHGNYIDMNEKKLLKECKSFTPNITCGKVIKVYDGDTITISTIFNRNKDEKCYRKKFSN
jgi:hypothetical protein